MEMILEHHFYIPLAIFAATCIVTIVLSASVLRPFSSKGKIMREMTKAREKSPFFFENYNKMNTKEYYDYFCQVSNDEESFFRYVIEDLHYYGKILSLKYTQIKYAYNGFIVGLILTVISVILVTIF